MTALLLVAAAVVWVVAAVVVGLLVGAVARGRDRQVRKDSGAVPGP